MDISDHKIISMKREIPEKNSQTNVMFSEQPM
jgi:hypothetical protein